MQPRIKNSRLHIILKNLSCVFILCTFLLSITPKQFLHFIVATHDDVRSKKIHEGQQYNTDGYNCDCNSIVATSPFSGIADLPIVQKLIHHTFYPVAYKVPLSAGDIMYANLRGPPVISPVG